MKVCTDSCLFGAWVASMHDSDARVKHVLDIGAGTGLLSLMLAQVLQAEFHAVELDAASAEQASENIQASSWANRIHVYQEDIRVHQAAQQYDLIISNPPFYENDLHSPDARINRARHDSSLSLIVLLEACRRLISGDGKLYLLLPAGRISDLGRLAAETGWHINQFCEVRQTARHQPFRVMLGLSEKESGTVQKDEIIIRMESQEYSSRFSELLRPYYLKL